MERPSLREKSNKVKRKGRGFEGWWGWAIICHALCTAEPLSFPELPPVDAEWRQNVGRTLGCRIYWKGSSFHDFIHWGSTGDFIWRKGSRNKKLKRHYISHFHKLRKALVTRWSFVSIDNGETPRNGLGSTIKNQIFSQPRMPLHKGRSKRTLENFF